MDYRGHGRHAEGRRRCAETWGHGGLFRSARRVGPDVSRGVADSARLFLRPESPWTEFGRHREKISSLPCGGWGESGPELSVHRNGRGYNCEAHVHGRGRWTETEPCEGRAVGRRLQGGKRTVSFCAHL